MLWGTASDPRVVRMHVASQVSGRAEVPRDSRIATSSPCEAKSPYHTISGNYPIFGSIRAPYTFHHGLCDLSRIPLKLERTT